VLDLLNFCGRVASAVLTITGAGVIDKQTLHGKAVAAASRRAEVPVVAVCGRSTLSRVQQAESGSTGSTSSSTSSPI
jgi:glycerate kinase